MMSYVAYGFAVWQVLLTVLFLIGIVYIAFDVIRQKIRMRRALAALKRPPSS
jgi:hypothetical protein